MSPMGRAEGALECLVCEGATVVVTRVPRSAGIALGCVLQEPAEARSAQATLKDTIGGTLEADLGDFDCLPISSPYFSKRLHLQAKKLRKDCREDLDELALLECCSAVDQ
eukprot:TRINITY_DN23855_c2_g1_i2.p2 TRINITY_DN23855_c2_g1~~TRINITY_DN23855_c2_g1_i2.p2  ORF type:complete len:110 (-),score=21.11 TRINITY_DN23855_c2_g1_i2:245-574(-)